MPMGKSLILFVHLHSKDHKELTEKLHAHENIKEKLQNHKNSKKKNHKNNAHYFEKRFALRVICSQEMKTIQSKQ